MELGNGAVVRWRSGEVAQWLAPRISLSSANREVGGSSLTVRTDDPMW